MNKFQHLMQLRYDFLRQIGEVVSHSWERQQIWIDTPKFELPSSNLNLNLTLGESTMWTKKDLWIVSVGFSYQSLISLYFLKSTSSNPTLLVETISRYRRELTDLTSSPDLRLQQMRKLIDMRFGKGFDWRTFPKFEEIETSWEFFGKVALNWQNH